MSKAPSLSSLATRIEKARAFRNPVKRIIRLAKMALRAGSSQAEPVLTAALDEASRIDDPILRDAGRDIVVDVLVHFTQYAQALALASKMESAYQRAICYAEIRHACRANVDKMIAKRADIGFTLAREQLDSDARADLERAVRFIEEE